VDAADPARTRRRCPPVRDLRRVAGIATNLLADRLRELEDAGLVERTELAPPVARTVYTLSEVGWVKVPP